MIEKHQYDYYDSRPRNYLGKLAHNFGRVIFLPTTFYGSILLAVIEYFGFHFLIIDWNRVKSHYYKDIKVIYENYSNNI